MKPNRPRLGFTLIELLVVVAVIAVLISILLPSLGRAREQGKMVKCLSNLRTIGQAMHMYFADNNGWFPYTHQNFSPDSFGVVHGFYYGGHPGRPDWWGYGDGWRNTPAGRPFNRYMWNNLPNYDLPYDDPTSEAIRKQMTVYECPSDSGAIWNNDGSFDPLGARAYDFCGSSYDLNYYYINTWALKFGSRAHRSLQLNRANAFLRTQMGSNASTLIALLEDPFDSAFVSKVPRRGWHKTMNRHNFLFMDGHSAPTLAKTYDYGDKSFAARGPGWKVAGAHNVGAAYAWWRNADDPDYKYRDIVPIP